MKMCFQLRNGEYSLSADQVKLLIEAQNNTRDRTLVRLLAETGIRRSEAANLKTEDIDFDQRTIVVRNGKGGKTRIVPITSTLAIELRQIRVPESDVCLFRSRQATGLSPRQINRIVAQAGQVAGVQSPNPSRRQVTCHLLRHTFARLWKAQGGSIESLSKILGHSSVKTTWDVYGTESLTDVSRNYDKTIEQMYGG